MKNLATLSKQSIVFTLALFLLLTGCSEDPASSPEEEQEEDFTLQGTDTIGPAGGALEAAGFSLSIPSGAFDADYELDLYASDSDDPFGTSSVTKTFRVEGLPDDFSQPLRVSLKYDGSLTGESFVGLGGWATDVLSGDSVIVYDLETATDSSGFLVAELPVPMGGVASRPSGVYRSPGNADDVVDQLLVAGTTGLGSHPTPGGHFVIVYPVSAVSSISALAEMLEDAYIISEADLGFSHNASLSWPLKVNVWGTNDADAFGVEWAVFLDDLLFGASIAVNEARLNQGDFPRLREEIGEVVLESALSGYDPSPTFWDPAHLWLHNAVVVWSDEKFSINPSYQYPDNFPGNEMAPFDGIRAGADLDVYDHGIGISTVIKYLVDRQDIYGLSGLVGTYDMIADDANPADPTAAILNSVNGLVADWWPDFFRKYVGGEIYNVSSTVFTDNANLSGVWNINDGDDTLKVFAATDPAVGPYPDLSAKLFLINLNYPTMDSNAQMVLEVSDNVGDEPVTMSLFGIQNGPLVYLGHTSTQSESFQIDGVRGYMDDGWTKFLVVVVNSDHDASSYTGQTEDIDLKITVEPGEYNRCSFGFKILSQLHQEYYNSTNDTIISDHTWGPKLSLGSFAGSFTGTTYEGVYDHQFADSTGRVLTWHGEITATRNQSGDMLTDVDLNYMIKDSSEHNLSLQEWTFSGGSIARLDNEPGVLKFRIEGEATCNSITDFDYTLSTNWHDQWYWETYDLTTTGYECDADSGFIEVRFTRASEETNKEEPARWLLPVSKIPSHYRRSVSSVSNSQRE